jgi:hypothetical protein
MRSGGEFQNSSAEAWIKLIENARTETSHGVRYQIEWGRDSFKKAVISFARITGHSFVHGKFLCIGRGG